MIHQFNISSTPVVMSGGIFSDLETYDSFGRELVEEGHNVWLIEMNGGPETDCVGKEEDDCPNYTFDDIAYHHFPASIAGVLDYSGKSEVNYVGHSNGGRSALFGLNQYSLIGKNNAGEVWDYSTGEWRYVDLPDHPVDKFFGVGVPSTLNGDSVFTSLAKNYGEIGINSISGEKHIYLSDYTQPIMLELTKENVFTGGTTFQKSYTIGSLLAYFGLSKLDGAPLSQNVMKMYNDLAADNQTELDLSTLEVNKLYLLNTDPEDLIVPVTDSVDIYNSATLIDSNDKDIIPFENPVLISHIAQTDNQKIKDRIMGDLRE
jgi:hypothetical protein